MQKKVIFKCYRVRTLNQPENANIYHTYQKALPIFILFFFLNSRRLRNRTEFLLLYFTNIL